jgi:hypothetical protein
MTGSRTRQPSSALFVGKLARLDRHHILPILEVAVADQQTNRRTKSLAVPNARYDFNLVAFNLHPPAAAIALLAPPELMVDAGGVCREPRGQTFDDDDQAFAV